jgi:hypothetical protein
VDEEGVSGNKNLKTVSKSEFERVEVKYSKTDPIPFDTTLGGGNRSCGFPSREIDFKQRRPLERFSEKMIKNKATTRKKFTRKSYPNLPRVI